MRIKLKLKIQNQNHPGMFSVVNVYLDHLKFCVVCIDGRMYVCCNVSALCNLSALTVVKLCTLGVFALG